jgi:hypothetical protein
MIKTLALFLAVMTLTATAAATHKSALRKSSALKSSTQSVITIIGATFGLLDVTSTVASLIQCNVPITASNNVFGDGWPGTVKVLSIAYQIRNGNVTVAVCEENQSITINCFEIYGASYGPADVTSQVQSLVSDASLSVEASNSVFGDPWYGNRKSLTIFYSDENGVNQVAVVQENNSISL